MSHKKEKKGLLALSSVAVIILWAVGTVILLVAIATIINQSTSTSKEVACRNSVALRAKATIDIPAIGEIDKFTPIVCEAQNIGELEGTREEIKQQISELTAKCWWMYLEGSVPNLFNIEKDKESCGICYYFRIPADMDPGEINNEYLHFEELTESKVSELKRTETDQDVKQKLEESLDKLEYETITQDGKEIIRPKNMILMQEIYNYLISEKYNPKILYGGGTKNYIGDKKEFETILNIPGPQEIKLRQIEELPPTQLIDYTHLITQETQQKITQFGTNLYRTEQSILLVIVADEIDRNDKTDARRVIEKLNLNSKKESYDAILITLDVMNGEVRVHIGGDLETKIKEHEISGIIDRHFNTIRSAQELNTALQNTITDLEQKIINAQVSAANQRFPEGTYYQYLSNEHTTVPIIENLEADKTYAITYKSMSDYQNWIKGVWDNSGTTVATVAAGTAIVGGLVLTFTGAGATIGLPLIKAGTLGIITATTAVTSVTSVSYFMATDSTLHEGIKLLRGRSGSGIGDNAIFVVPASSISGLCDEV